MNIKNQSGEVSLGTVLFVILAVLFMFLIPLIALANKNDQNNQQFVQSKTDEIVANITQTGVLTKDTWENYKVSLNSTGSTYDAEIEIKVLDENIAKKRAQGQAVVSGENVYYSQYTTEIEAQLNNSGKITLKEGDTIKISVKNTSQTFAEMLNNIWVRITGNEAATIQATASGTVSK